MLVLGLSGMPVPQSQKASNQAITNLFNAGPKLNQPQVASPPPSTFSTPPPQPARTPDPFAALASTPRQASPFQYQQSVKPPAPASSGVVDLLGGAITTPATNPAQDTNAANDDDEWNFASSVPDTSKELTVNNTSIHVLFNISRETDTVLLIQSRISNNTSLPISGLTFQVAASKVTLDFERWIHHILLTNIRVPNCSWNRNPASISRPTRNMVSLRTSV